MALNSLYMFCFSHFEQVDTQLQLLFHHSKIIQFLGQLRKLFGLGEESLLLIVAPCMFLKGVKEVDVQKCLNGVPRSLEKNREINFQAPKKTYR